MAENEKKADSKAKDEETVSKDEKVSTDEKASKDEKVSKGGKSSKKAKEQEKKPNIFVRAWRRIKKWCREMKSELKKVQWPTRSQTIKNTITVIVVVLVVGVCIWIFDAVSVAVVKALINLFS